MDLSDDDDFGFISQEVGDTIRSGFSNLSVENGQPPLTIKSVALISR